MTYENLMISDGNPYYKDNDLVAARLDHIELIPRIHKKARKDPEYTYCRIFYDTLFDLLMHGY